MQSAVKMEESLRSAGSTETAVPGQSTQHKRKNWLFSGTPEGAEASVLLYSLIETAKANKLEPYAYLRHLFDRLATASTLEDYEALLPWNVNLGKDRSVSVA
jgi:hypothetical protein